MTNRVEMYVSYVVSMEGIIREDSCSYSYIIFSISFSYLHASSFPVYFIFLKSVLKQLKLMENLASFECYVNGDVAKSEYVFLISYSKW